MGTPVQQNCACHRASPFTRHRNKTFRFHTNLSTTDCATMHLAMRSFEWITRNRRSKKIDREDAMKRRMALAASFAALIGAMSAAHAVEFPTKPITLVLGFAPGGPSDVM